MKKQVTLFFFLFVCFINTCIITRAQVSVQDSLTLVDLYYSTNGPGWKHQENWLSGPVKNWLGITVSNNKVTKVNLFDNYLTGSIPPSLGTLADLTKLDLSINNLTGTIPVELTHLSNLTSLVLGENQLTGSIPPELGDMIHLALLSVVTNQLTGSIPPELGKLTGLTQLILGENQLSGNIPAELGKLEKLDYLELAYNQLTGNIPAELGGLPKLTYLFVNNNKLSGTVPPELGNLEDLFFLDLSYNLFTFNGMELIARKYNFAKYHNQAQVPIRLDNGALTVAAGGTISNNTYNWFKVDNADSAIIVNDSVFFPIQGGRYFAKVTSTVCTQLTLYTDTFNYEVLPVSIVNLKAQHQGKIIKVDWSSLSEINMHHYEIERCANAFDFYMIGSLPAKGKGTEQTDYTFSDLHPLQGNNFYRLKAIDRDSKITYSATVLINLSSANSITLVYPVPAYNVLHIQTNVNTSFSLINQAGKILLTKNINGNGSINISGISAGMYYLKNNSNGNVQKIIISR